MRGAFMLAKKDLASFFRSWIGVLLFVFYFLISGIFFSILVLSFAKISLNASQNAYQGVQGLGLTRFVFGSFFLNLAIILVFLVPILSMRAFAEERKQETLELLFTYPLSDFEIVWGKLLGMAWFFGLLFLPTFFYVFYILWVGGSPDWGPVLGGFLGFWLLGSAYLSLGLFVSAISENPVVSAAVSFSLLIIFWIFDWVVGVTDGRWSLFFAALSPLAHYREFTLGVVDLSNLAYFIFFHLYFLFLTLRAIETRNWKG